MKRKNQPRNLVTENRAYHLDHSHLSSSMITDWLNWRNPRRWAERYVFGTIPPEPETDDKFLGTLIHLAVFSPREFPALVSHIPKAVGRRGTETYNDWLSRAMQKKPDSYIVRDAHLEKVKAARKAVLRHPIAGNIAEANGEVELEHRFQFFGANCKIKLDKVFGGDQVLFVCDLKKTRLPYPDEEEFAKEVRIWGYHRSAALQLIGLSDWAGHRRATKVKLLWLVVSSETFSVYVHQPSRPTIERGRIETERAILEITECRERDRWPDTSAKIGTININWRKR